MLSKLKMIVAAIAGSVGVLGFQASAQAIESQKVLGRGKVVSSQIPAGTPGFTLLLEGDGTMNLADSYGMFVKDADQSTNQVHFSAPEESTESVVVRVPVTQPSSRDSSTLTLVLDQENESGSDLPKAGFGILGTIGTHPTAPHSALVGNIRLEKPTAPNSNIAFTGEFEYAGEKLGGELARWPQTGSSQDDLRLWAGVAGRPRLGMRWGVEGGIAFNPYGSNVAATPLGLRAELVRPIEPGNWVETWSRTQTLVGLSGFSVSQQLSVDAAWFRWGTRYGALAFTAGAALDARYDGAALNADLEPRLSVQLANSRWGTLRSHVGIALGDRPGWRTGLSLLQF